MDLRLSNHRLFVSYSNKDVLLEQVSAKEQWLMEAMFAKISPFGNVFLATFTEKKCNSRIDT